MQGLLLARGWRIHGAVNKSGCHPLIPWVYRLRNMGSLVLTAGCPNWGFPLATKAGKNWRQKSLIQVQQNFLRDFFFLLYIKSKNKFQLSASIQNISFEEKLLLNFSDF